MKDHYTTLGLDRTASDEDIKRAYRKLASQHHPDKGGNKERFQEIQAAYAILGDAGKRAEYDNPRPHMHHPFAQHTQFNFDDIFSMFGTKFHDHSFHQNPRPSSVRIQLWIGLQDAALGGPRSIGISTPQGHTAVELMIPPGVEDGDSVRYPGLAPNGSDIVALYRIRPDEKWQRQGSDVITEIIVPLWDLLLGKDLHVTTVNGTTVEVTVNPGTQPGTLLRVRGHGLPKKQTKQRGDMLLRVQTRLPESIPEELRTQIQRLRDK